MEAITREEKIMSGEKLTPITRKEMFLAKAAGQNIKTPEPITREEMFLSNVSGGGTSGTTDERFKQLVERTITDISDDTVTSVGQYAFYGCSKLTSVNLPLVTSVGLYAFYGCSKLTSVNLPLVTSVGLCAFCGCSELTSVNLSLVTSVGSNAFQRCTQLTSIDLSLVTSVGDYTFQGCSRLTSIDLSLVTSVGDYTFQGCSRLTSIDLPLVTSVGDYAFRNCLKLSCVIFRTETICALFNANAFADTPFASGKAGGTFIFPRSLTTEYPNATNWSSVISRNANNRVLALEDYTVDGTITGEIDWDKLNGEVSA